MMSSAIVIAHLGAMVSLARFTSPTPPVATRTFDAITVEPYTFDSADQSFRVAWNDGDNDPTARYYFYYLDHAPTSQVPTPDLQRLATPIPGPPSDGIWASCDCSTDAGVTCIDDGGPRDCRNEFTWDTSQVPTGSYWLIAVNVDPPYLVHSVSRAPVRIAHGGAALPPAAIVLLPDGFGAHAGVYRTQWLAAGAAPLSFDLSYGIDRAKVVLNPTTPIVRGISPTPLADGSYVYDWDLGAIEDNVYFLRVTVRDGQGVSAYTDSALDLTVFHPPDLGAAVDAGTTTSKSKGCGCDVGNANVNERALLLALGGFLLLRRRAPSDA